MSKTSRPKASPSTSMNKKRKKRRQSKEIGYLFDLYAANLSMHTSDHPDAFACPICFRVFSRDAIQSKQLDRAHIIPKALRGKLKTLTCRDCNNRLGYLADHHLVTRLRVEDQLSGRSGEPLRGEFAVGGGKMTADFHLSKGGIKIEGIPELSNPALRKIVEEQLASGAKQFSISGNLGYKDVPSDLKDKFCNKCP